MVAREDAQMVAGLVTQPVVVVCVEPHEYGGATAQESRDLGRNAALFQLLQSAHTPQSTEGIVVFLNVHL